MFKEFYYYVMFCVLYKIDYVKQFLNKCEFSNMWVVFSIRDLIFGDEENVNFFGIYLVMDKLLEFLLFEYNDKIDVGLKQEKWIEWLELLFIGMDINDNS